MASQPSDAKRVKFLTSLSLGNTISKACEHAGVSRRTVYHWRSEDPEFEGQWDEAQAASIDELEEELRKRALDRDDRQSHVLLMFLLKKINPEYRDKHTSFGKRTHKAQEIDFSGEEVAEALEILTSAKKRATET